MFPRRSRHRREARSGASEQFGERLFRLDTRVADVVQPAVAVPLETAREELPNAERQSCGESAPVRLAGQDRGERVGHGLAVEGLAAGQQLVDNDAEGPDVGPLVHRLAAAPPW